MPSNFPRFPVRVGTLNDPLLISHLNVPFYEIRVFPSEMETKQKEKMGTSNMRRLGAPTSVREATNSMAEIIQQGLLCKVIFLFNMYINVPYFRSRYYISETPVSYTIRIYMN